MTKPGKRSKALGYLGPLIVIVGAAVAGVGIWYVKHARPVATDVIDTIDIGHGRSIVLRNESDKVRSFIEFHSGDKVKWQALIPHYAGTKGRPAIAWGPDRVTVRVDRSGRAEVFGFLLSDEPVKLGTFRLAPEHEPIQTQPDGPITLTDQERSYELVGGADWHELIAVDLRIGKGVWKVDLGPKPITRAGIDHQTVWVEQGGKLRAFAAGSGRETPPERAY